MQETCLGNLCCIVRPRCIYVKIAVPGVQIYHTNRAPESPAKEAVIEALTGDLRDLLDRKKVYKAHHHGPGAFIQAHEKLKAQYFCILVRRCPKMSCMFRGTRLDVRIFIWCGRSLHVLTAVRPSASASSVSKCDCGLSIRKRKQLFVVRSFVSHK
ncbi:unnamed protein product [Durusdinium trenchii]|uniref:Uncharacterized protein n=1 Tax=Durusdinium trenchii TaxID=1381693 RepID=A0ABP0JQX3_9DINO